MTPSTSPANGASTNDPDESGAVYFGDFKSPEYKFAFLFRSSDPKDNISAPGTPDNDIVDEPSSVLASRVLSAQGNPSPPPSPCPSQTGTSELHLLPLVLVPSIPPPPRTLPFFPTVSPTTMDIEQPGVSQNLFQPSAPETSSGIEDADVFSTTPSNPLQGDTLRHENPETVPDVAEQVEPVDTTPGSRKGKTRAMLPVLSEFETPASLQIDAMSKDPLPQNSDVLDEDEQGAREMEDARNHRELRSLSPSSSSLLMKLLPDELKAGSDDSIPNLRAPVPPVFTLPNNFPSTPTTCAVKAAAGTSQPHVSLRTQSPIRSQPPIRFTSPIRHISPTRPQSSIRFPSPSRNTGPVKFVPPGSSSKPPLSALKTPGRDAMLYLSKSPIPQLPASVKKSSPSKNQLSSQTTTYKPPSSTPGYPSPLKRSTSAEPQARVTPKPVIVRAHSVEPKPTVPKKGLPLDLHAIPEDDGAGKMTPLPYPIVAAEKNSTQQRVPAAKASSFKHTTSKIPRIGVKPYSRQAAAKLSSTIPHFSQSQKAPFVIKRVEATTSARSSGLVSSQTSSNLKDKSTTPLSSLAQFPPAVSLKRKREDVGVAPADKSQPNQVGRRAILNDVQASPAKKAATLIIRKFEEHHATPSISFNDNDTPLDQAPGPDSLPKSDIYLEPPPSVPTSPPPSSPISTSQLASFSDHSPPLPGVRRTTRLRKPAATHVDTCSKVAAPKPRRKPPTQRTTPNDSGALLGMTAGQLKALTNSNTAKNQNYLVARLETEIIKKEGARPDSPTSKVMLNLQKRKDEVDAQREARAQRRARRSGEEVVDADDSLLESDLGFRNDREKHRRGPGDEEEYETPQRPARPLKRPKFNDDLEESETPENGEERRVRWDRGLFTTIFLEEIFPKGRAYSSEAFGKKGCLAEKAKSLRLDTLGNLENANTPLDNLIPQNVVVKKFVYDDDIPIIVSPAKATRSKSKNSK